ncbi:MAG TPA: DUF4252 domain-containing protein [Thermoanaerobaculia bacterium]|jgi:hypothetical protein|nr:DUF4252 domain-containing protein [Thermoanaerobaculia bacterium]
MRKLVIVLTLMLAVAIPASAQRINLDFPGLAERAEEVVDVTLDASMLRLAAKFLGGNDPDEREIREMINGLQGIYVRSYEFAKDGEYDRALIDRVKSQLGPTWKPLVTVRSKTKENVNIMADVRGDRIHGLVIIATEPREFTIVNIVGDIDIDRLSRLEGEFGIPKITKEKDHDND